MNALPFRLQLRRRSTPSTRCPFCRDDCGAEGAYACAGCLARHHATCWSEGQGCSVCRARAPLVPAGATARSVGSTVRDPDYEQALDSWARLWLFYAVSLGVLALVIGWSHPRPLLFGGVVANACFLFGPALELALIRADLGQWEALRFFLFWSGYLFTLLVLAAAASLPILGEIYASS